jgi:hypothetical protein
MNIELENPKTQRLGSSAGSSKQDEEGYSDEEYGEKFGTEKLNELRNVRQEKLEIAKRFNSSQKVP